MAKSQNVRSFSIKLAEDKPVVFKISEPPLRAEGLSLETWTSSFILANLLRKIEVDLSNASKLPVLELGAGTGLVGLTAAALWHTYVVLTDLPPIVPGLAGNIALNAAQLSEASGKMDCGSLDWKDPEVLTLEQGVSCPIQGHQASVILAADTVYSEDHPELLSQVICKWLAPGSKSRVILAYPLRVAYIDQIRELWELLEAGGLESISEGREQANSDAWDDECLIEWCVWRWKVDNTNGTQQTT